MNNENRYSVVVREVLDADEACYEARVRELPDLREYGDTAEEAYQLAIDAIEVTAQIFKEKGRDMPALLDVPDDFSGRVTLRLPKTLHRALAEAAIEEDVSLNQHLVNVLTYFTGFAHAQKSAVAHWKPATSAPRARSHLTVVETFPLINKQAHAVEAGEWRMAANT